MTTYAGLMIAAALSLGGWMVAQSRDEHGQPRKGTTRLGTVLAAMGLLLGVLAVPSSLPPATFAAGLAGVLAVGLLLLRGAAVRATGWTSTAEAFTTAVGLAWASPRRAMVSLCCLAGGLTLAGMLAQRGEPLSALLGALAVLAAARWWWRAAWARERTRTAAEGAVAGVLSGGPDWDPAQAAVRQAPVRVRFDAVGTPVAITGPLPPQWRADRAERDRAEIRARLERLTGLVGAPWAVDFNSTARTIRAERCAPLPAMLGVPQDRSWGWIDKHKPSPLALYLGEAQDANTGESFPLWWDPDATDPHALIGGKTKSGKTVGLRLLVAQAIARGWDVIIADPKGVDFVWAGRLPGVRYFPGPDCLQGIVEAIGEMKERQAWLGRNLWTGGEGADEQGDLLKVQGQPYRPCLVIVDEAAEAAGLGEKEEQAATAAGLSSLARLSRFARVLYGSAGPTLTNMVLDMPARDLAKLSDSCRGRGRAVIMEGTALEFQGGFIAPAAVKRLRGVLAADRLPKPRFAKVPEWHGWVRDGAEPPASALQHRDYDRVAKALDDEIAARDAQIEAGKVADGPAPVPAPDSPDSGDSRPGEMRGGREPKSAKPKPEKPSEADPDSEIDPLDFFEG